MKSLVRILLCQCIAYLSFSAHAENLIVGTPSTGGTGCPAGTANVTISPDGDSLTLLFDNYVAEAGGITGKTMDRKSCNVAVPVTVPQGFSVAVFQVDYRGFNSIPLGGMSRFQAEYFWAGARGPTQTRVFSGPSNQNFTLTDKLVAQTLVWAPCGASVNLRANTNLMVRTNAAQEEVMSTIDSADVSSKIVYHFQWRRCN